MRQSFPSFRWLTKAIRQNQKYAQPSIRDRIASGELDVRAALALAPNASPGTYRKFLRASIDGLVRQALPELENPR